MNTCKDCIHEVVCSALIEKGLPWADGTYPADAFCMAFRNKAEWISVDERLPEESGEYLVLTPWGGQSVLCYSKVHKLFNAVDSDNNAHHAKKYSVDVAYWMPLPEPPKMKGGAE